MRRIKVIDKDENTKGYLKEVDGSINFSVTENGFGDLNFTYVGDEDVEHGDLIKIIETEGNTITTTIENTDCLDFDGTNDYAQSGYSIARRGRGYMTSGGLTFSSDGYGNYYTNFVEGTATNYIDVGLPFDEIVEGTPFSIKMVCKTGSAGGNKYIFYHNNFGIRQLLTGPEITVGFEGGVTKSFPIAVSTYYRIVVVYDGTNIRVRYNGVEAVGTSAIIMDNHPYCSIGNAPTLFSQSFGIDARRYNTCLRDRVLTAGEVTNENASHTTVTTTNRVWNISADTLGTGTVDNIVWDGVVSGYLTTSTNIAISGWFKTDIDGVDTDNSQPIVVTPYVYVHLRKSTNELIVRYDNAGERSSKYALGNGDRQRHHFVATACIEGGTWMTSISIDGVIQDADFQAVGPSTKYIDYIELGKKSTIYFNGKIKDIRIHTYTGYLQNSDITLLFNGMSPIYTTAIIEYKRYQMNEGTGTLLNNNATIYGATRITDATAPFINTYKTVNEKEIYYGQVVATTPRIGNGQGKKTDVNCLGIQTVLNDFYFRGPTGSTTYSDLLYTNNILQYVYDNNENRYLDYGNTDLMDYPNWLEDRRRYRTNMYISGTDADGVYGVAWADSDLSMFFEKRLPVTPTTNTYIIQFRVKVTNASKTFEIQYAVEGDSYFSMRTYTISTANERKRISAHCSRGVAGSAVKWKIVVGGTASGIIYFKDFKVYRIDDTNIPSILADILDINYNNNKCLDALQNALEYSGGKIKREVTKYPMLFTPNLSNTPDHYLIESRDLLYLEKSVKSDDLINSVQVIYDGGTTSSITDSTSITNYRKREIVLNNTDLGNSASAIVYGNTYLSKNKDPKTYVKAIVSKAYNIRDLKVGDLVEINANSLNVTKGYITRLDMGTDTCTIYLGNYDGLGKSLSKI